MRVFILENCVVAGSVWFGGEEVYVDEALGREMVARGVAREMIDLTPDPFPKGKGSGVEIAVGKRERRQ